MTLTVFITGATSGFGEAIARRFIRDGHRVIATGRRKERLDHLHAELGPQCLPWPLDVTDAKAVADLPGQLPPQWRDIDVLVNNAGLARGLSPAQDSSLQDWDQMVATNISGLMHITRAFLPGLVARGHGTIVNIGSTAGSYPYPGGNVYGATKAFVKQFTLNLRADLIGTGVRVTDIEPGLVGGSEFSKVRLGSQEKADQVYAGTQPLMPDDIAESVAWVVNLPAHFNVNRLEIMPTCQAAGPLAVKRAQA